MEILHRPVYIAGVIEHIVQVTRFSRFDDLFRDISTATMPPVSKDVRATRGDGIGVEINISENGIGVGLSAPLLVKIEIRSEVLRNAIFSVPKR